MTTMADRPHVLVIPCPAQGHVMPLLKFSYCLVHRGCRITFMVTEFIYDMLNNSLKEKGKKIDGISLVSVPDGLAPEERNNPDRVHAALAEIMPAELEKLIRNCNEIGGDGKIACVVADETIGWVSDAARKMGMRHASFIPTAAGLKAMALHCSRLIEDGAIDESGAPKTNDTIIWSPAMPDIKTSRLPWNCTQGLLSPENIFRMVMTNHHSSKNANWTFCNTFDELEPEAIALIPNLLPIGPLLGSNQLGSFWAEDLSCLSWLDQQAASSVIYLAFGSTAFLNQHQIHELAHGLELLGRPFLWVIRTGKDLLGRPTTTYPDGFVDRVANFGKIVSWAPQQKVLSHPSIACFVSHCGWNSTMDGVSMGVPFICWPYFGDQQYNETCITDVWKIGLGLNVGEDEIISGEAIKAKIEQLLRDKNIKENSQKFKEMAMKTVARDGPSTKNLDLFMKELRC